MRPEFPLFPEQASTVAAQVDALYYFLIGVSLFFATLIFLLVVSFAIKYRRRSEDERPQPIHGDLRLELVWTIIPLGIAMLIFVWGANLYFTLSSPPSDALNLYVVGKQWMWKIQHPTGQREINQLHVPVGQPVKLTMTSEDVIHSFFVPAFRIKMDVVPGRYTTAWFEATKAGEYHLFCTEYCGTKHSQMLGRVVVMEPVQYEQWLQSGTGTGAVAVGEAPAVAGARLFKEQRCVTCHAAGVGGLVLGPSLAGLFGKAVQLQTGETVTADESYLRESILNPTAKIVVGYQPLMPTYQGQISEDELFQLIAYIRSLEQATETTGEAKVEP
jgi:cytochrome c oxidase subunit 2